MAFKEAFNDLVLKKMRDLATQPGTRTHDIVADTRELDDDGVALLNKKGDPIYLRDATYDHPVYDDRIRSMCNCAQGCYHSDEEVLWYTYCYMPMHVEVARQALTATRTKAANLRQCLVDSDGDLLFVDVGCGPLTAGVAIADWYIRRQHEPLSLSYIAIDPSNACTRMAANFASREDVFNHMERFRVFDTVDDCKINTLKKRVSSGGMVMFLLSHLFGQRGFDEREIDKLSAFVNATRGGCQPARTFIFYTNTTYNEVVTAQKYDSFRQSIGGNEIPAKHSYRREGYRGFAEIPYIAPLSSGEFISAIEELA